MGAYLSEPITEKHSSDYEGVNLKCGASSMQGWRVSQEDAHNCIIEYDKEAALFAVYDGHGGHEVAEYCAENLPDFIKHTESYKKGDYEKALRDAFLEFDATLATQKVISVLKEIASSRDSENKTVSDPENGDEDDEEEEAISHLYEEARMPLDELMAKYQKGENKCPIKRRLGTDSKPPVSPFLRARRPTSGASTSSANDTGPSCSASSASSHDDGEVTSSSGPNEAQAAYHKSLCNGEVMTNGEVNDSEVGGSEDAKVSAEVCIKKDDECVGGSGDSDTGICVAASSDVKVEKSEKISKDRIVESSGDVQGPVPDSSGDLPNGETHRVSSSSQNGDAEPSPSTEDNGDKISSSCSTKERKAVLRVISSNLEYKKFLEDYDSEEEDDETFVGEVEDSEDDADSAIDEEGVEEEGEEEESVDDEGEEDDTPFMDVKDEKLVGLQPGSDSGCTAVVALIKGTDLYVANAGDSRCVVCREGKAVEMSLDHKPEDRPERERIEAAGGNVTDDGRVNGGLNLSRALGDHSYKQVKALPATQQMITALPDVERLQINPATDEFMVLACDGIWNFMSSQDVVTFIRKRIQENKEVKLSKICEELFDLCLAPDTFGDGTGCDNMTCVIVQFLQHQNTNKRPHSPSVENTEDSKRMKKDDIETESATTITATTTEGAAE